METVVNNIIGVMRRFNFNQAYYYPAGTEENILLSALEDCRLFTERDGFVFITGTDSLDYASGNNPALALAWDGSRPNLGYVQVGDSKLGYQTQQQLLQAAANDGYAQYTWIDPYEIEQHEVERTAYVKFFDSYLLIGVATDSDRLPDEEPVGRILTQFLAQLTSQYALYSVKVPERYPRFVRALDDGQVVLIRDNGEVIIGNPTISQIEYALELVGKQGGGQLEDGSYCTRVPFLNYILWWVDRTPLSVDQVTS